MKLPKHVLNAKRLSKPKLTTKNNKEIKMCP